MKGVCCAVYKMTWLNLLLSLLLMARCDLSQVRLGPALPLEHVECLSQNVLSYWKLFAKGGICHFVKTRLSDSSKCITYMKVVLSKGGTDCVASESS